MKADEASGTRRCVLPAAGRNSRRLLTPGNRQSNDKARAHLAVAQRRIDRAKRRSSFCSLHQGPLQSHRDRRPRCFVRYRLYRPCSGLARPPYASTHSPPERCASTSARGLPRRRAASAENQHTCAGPHPDDEHVRSEVGVAARELRAPEKLATALQAAQAFCHDANAVAPRV